jgi:hypothetical protein
MEDVTAVTNPEAKRELGTGLMFIALGVWMAAALVLFFFPAALELGHYMGFLGVIVGLAVLGVVLMISGYLMRGQSEEE